MNAATKIPIETLAEFLAHAIVLEQESVERYQQLADSMETHNNIEVAKLFRKLAHFGEKHAHEVEEHARAIDLPQISPWEFKWQCPESPESPCFDDAHYLMTTRQALTIARHNEQEGQHFYAQVAAESSNEEVRKLAAEFAEEEAEHVQILDHWLVNLTDPDSPPLEDLDPPNVVE
jgi:rubrerythrin